MCKKAVEDEPKTIKYVHNHVKTKEMYEKAIEEGLYNLKFALDHFITQEICERAIEDDPSFLQCVQIGLLQGS